MGSFRVKGGLGAPGDAVTDKPLAWLSPASRLEKLEMADGGTRRNTQGTWEALGQKAESRGAAGDHPVGPGTEEEAWSREGRCGRWCRVHRAPDCVGANV